MFYSGYSSDDEDHECQTCTRRFRTWPSCRQHMNDTDHWAPTYDCEVCTKEFSSEHAANQHMSAVGHWAPRTFQNRNSLNMHMRSKAHLGGSIACPFCGVGFTTASGLVHHLERGACPRAPSLNRETILRKVRELDPNGRITNRQIEWRDEDNVQYSATQHAFNGQYWQCYLCSSTFNSVNGPNSHLNSPVHKQKVYRCPNRLNRCLKEFVTLAALFNHLESESCAAMRFEVVQRGVNDMLMGRRLIGM
ncbi:uncharacterized protein GIQ15_06074 [Arthroderma uncinatum]|uniref:uncharacterized protein n=1 Tax=Arthroderma uncinatum TaxID=74035 RepID=UPI00144AA16C|nr:uncharacterized protein GIQ15_06074 [Arthroderma uncinatum]KAF3480727.1 hypothetical protein GIQ15_06074 [Arthroderma uncinatum]